MNLRWPKSVFSPQQRLEMRQRKPIFGDADENFRCHLVVWAGFACGGDVSSHLSSHVQRV